MPNESCVDVRQDELAEIAASVFDSMLHLETDTVGGPWQPGEDRLNAVVHLAGGWSGLVVLECDTAQARRLTGRFLSMDPPELVDDIVRDVMGELANMIAGNLKSVLSPGIAISVPTVVDGDKYNLRHSGAEIRDRLGLRSVEGEFWITVLALRN
jgi:chemotaxis protein CheX